MLGRNTMDNADSIQTNTGLIDSNTKTVDAASQATEETAGILGNTNGKDKASLLVSNIPNHNHNLIGDQETEYYVINNNSGTPAESAGFPGDGPSSAGVAQYYNSTGDMIGASTNPLNPLEYQVTPFNIMNPYLTINYIIYSGKFN